jgi:hypothetical protein
MQKSPTKCRKWNLIIHIITKLGLFLGYKDGSVYKNEEKKLIILSID